MSKFDDLSDEKLVEKTITENQEFFGFLVKRYQEKLLRYNGGI